MCDDDIHQGEDSFKVAETPMNRRAFGLAAAAAATFAADMAHAEATVTEKDVDIKTADGVADAALFYPSGKGKWPAVLIWTDIFGLRPVFRDMGKRLAAQGYVVLVPNPFYRKGRADTVAAGLDFAKPDDRPKLMALAGSIGAPNAAETDASAFLAFLDAQPQTNKRKKAGVQGYCMGGALSFRSAAAVPARIAAVGSFHGGNGLVTTMPSSPHLLIPKTNASFVIAQAQNDDKAMPTVKDALKAAFAEAKRPATVEVFQADHGWCVPGGAVYNEAEAERAWAELTALYKKALV
jgi:carboxymethylenebutenolidase